MNKDSMNRELSQGLERACECVCMYAFVGSVIKKARRQGVKVETLKLPPIVDFDSGLDS